LDLIKRSGQANDYKLRKASTLERDTLPPSTKERSVPHSASLPLDASPPQVSVKPRRDFKHRVDRMMVAQSMIETWSSRTSYEDLPQVTPLGEQSKLLGKIAI